MQHVSRPQRYWTAGRGRVSYTDLDFPLIFLTGRQVVPVPALLSGAAPAPWDGAAEIRKRASCMNVRHQILMEVSFFFWHAPSEGARTLSPGVVTRESTAGGGSEAYELMRFYVTQSNIKTIICFTTRDVCAVGAPIKAACKSVYKVGLSHQPRALDIAQAVTFSF